MPATNVPCPYPSPGEFGARVVRLTWPTTRLPKSDRPASMPESTIAIVAASGADLVQSTGAPVAHGQSCEFDSPVAVPRSAPVIVSLGPIAVTYDRFASERICRPDRVAWIPSIV